MDDEQIISLCMAGDEQALAAIRERYGIRLLRKNGIPLLVDHDSTLLHGLEPGGGWYCTAPDGSGSMSCIEFRELIDISDFCGVQVGDTIYKAR